MSDPAGRLNITLHRGQDGLCCRIRSSRPVMASTVFRGRSAEETALLLPRLYSICAQAQSFACVGALESALGLTVTQGQWQSRLRVLGLETVREHLWRMFLDWPRILDLAPERETLAALLSLVKTLFGLANPDGRLFRPGAPAVDGTSETWREEISRLVVLVETHLLGASTEEWLERVVDEAALRRWAASTTTVPARLIASVIDNDEQALGRSPVSALPAMSGRDLATRLLGTEAADFIARPTWDNAPHETSPLTRNAHAPLIRELTRTYGNGLLTRLAAQLLEVARLLKAAYSSEVSRPLNPDQSGIHHIDDHRPHEGHGSRSECELHCIQFERRTSNGHGSQENDLPLTGVGIGQAEAARGHLVHLARLEQDRITDYRILAPTEWNFHPEGPLATALSALPDSEDDQLRRRAELLIMAIDPCVAYELSLSNGSKITETRVGYF